MPRGCDKLMNVGRRQFLRGAGFAAVGAAATTLPAAEASAAPSGALIRYPSARLGNIDDLMVDEPFYVAYPDDEAPGVLLKLGRRVAGGAGPEGDVVGFSTVCPHKGFPLVYSAADKTLNCPGHYSRFDCEAGGQQTWGQATQNLAQYNLRIDEKGNIFAEGIDELLYGRIANVL